VNEGRSIGSHTPFSARPEPRGLQLCRRWLRVSAAARTIPAFRLTRLSLPSGTRFSRCPMVLDGVSWGCANPQSGA